jgi:hypothetical protein
VRVGRRASRPTVIAAGTTLLMRLAGIRWQIALPVFQPRAESSKQGID